MMAMQLCDDRDDQEPSGSLFVPYVPAKLTGGKPHPAVIVESASMAAVVPPDISYKPHLAAEIVSEGQLSEIQLERVIYAGQRHEQRLPDGARAGFFVGDGTGVGKGRVLAGIIADNWNQNRQRAIWLSVNNDLLESARRDLSDLGLENITLARINDYPPAGEIALSHLMGHSSVGVTAGYAHATPSVIQSAVNKLAEPRGEVVQFARRAG